MENNILEKVKLALRIKTNKFDEEIKDLISSAKMDLKISGIVMEDDTDSLIAQAIKVYCKANFGLDNKDSEKYQKAYESLKNHLALCGDYNV